MTEPLSQTERVALLANNYSSEAAVYERLWAPGLREAGRRLLDRMDLNAATAVLDLGTGIGALLTDIAARAPGAMVVGADRSEGMVARAQPRFGRIVLDATQLGCRSGSFDLVTMIFVLFHLPDPSIGLEEARRVLRPGGKVGSLTWGEEEGWPALAVWGELLDEHGADPPAPLLSQHELVDTCEKVEKLFREAGFVSIETWNDVLEREWEPQTLIEFATGMAIPKRRFDSLPPDNRQTFLEAARLRLERLDPEAFSQSSEVVCVTARVPGPGG